MMDSVRVTTNKCHYSGITTAIAVPYKHLSPSFIHLCHDLLFLSFDILHYHLYMGNFLASNSSRLLPFVEFIDSSVLDLIQVH
jgi:hypothetical protein